uniref:Uncharacterized protein n=1 Tax=Junco hyemalis TaxID=40217 RepID=A0A8C5NPM2_JUNHY
MEPLRPWLVPFLLPEHCFDRFFLHFQLLDGFWATGSWRDPSWVRFRRGS